MTLEQLEYALAVGDHRSFVKAAESFQLSQPALTMQLRKLEDELGITLFDRSHKPLQITTEGASFLEKARELILNFKELKQVAHELKHKQERELSLGVIPTLAPFLLPLFINHFRESYPEVQLLIYELTTEEIIRQIKSGWLNAGIVATPLQTRGISAKVLFYERFFLYVSHQHPWYQQEVVSQGELAKADLWLLKEGNCFRSQANDICQHKQNRDKQGKLAYESSSIQSLMRIVESQNGATLIPELATLAVSSEQESMLKSIKGNAGVREVSLIHSRLYTKEQLLDKMQDSIRKHVPKHMLGVGQHEIIDSFVKA